MAHTLCTFNANNLFLRYRFTKSFPGDRSGGEAPEGWGFLPMYSKGQFQLFDEERRKLTALAITRGSDNPDTFPAIVCMQEVENLLAFREFNDRYLQTAYPYAFLVDSRDFRQIDVGILSKLEILGIRSHIDDPDPEDDKFPWLFSRDCLEVDIALNKSGSKTLTLFINHFKSKFVEPTLTPEKQAEEVLRANAKRARQAGQVQKIIRERWPGSEFDNALFAVVGDFNDEPESQAVASLVRNSGLVDVLGRIPAVEERWTHYYKSEGEVAQLDYILASPALDRESAGSLPVIERRGIGCREKKPDGTTLPKKAKFKRVGDDPNPVKIDFQFPRFELVTSKNVASDHCPVFFEF